MKYLKWKFAFIDIALIILGLIFIQPGMPAILQVLAIIFLILGIVHLFVFLISKMIVGIIKIPFKIAKKSIIIIVVIVGLAVIFVLNLFGTFYKLNEPLNDLFVGEIDLSCNVVDDCGFVLPSCSPCAISAWANKEWKPFCPFKNPSPLEVGCPMMAADFVMDPYPYDYDCINNTCIKLRK